MNSLMIEVLDSLKPVEIYLLVRSFNLPASTIAGVKETWI